MTAVWKPLIRNEIIFLPAFVAEPVCGSKGQRSLALGHHMVLLWINTLSAQNAQNEMSLFWGRNPVLTPLLNEHIRLLMHEFRWKTV